MKKINFILVLVSLFIISSCNNEDQLLDENQSINKNIDQSEPLSKEEVNNQINEIIEKEGAFDWSKASDFLLWSASMHGDKMLTIGYGNKGESFREENNKSLDAVKKELLTLIEVTSKSKATAEILIYEDKVLNYIDVNITDLSSVIALRKHDKIRYLEPEGFVYSGFDDQRSNAGCDKSGDYISSSDYGTLPSGAKFPWNFYDHKINQAWSYSKGRGVGVAVIDTGVSPSQNHLSYKFDDYYSGRYLQKYGTYIDSNWWWSNNLDGPNDKCGHGTSAISTIAAPNNNSSKFVGVAYECNMISYRGTSDVVLNDYHERKGVANALIALGNRSDVKIISMSIGYPWSIGRIKDAVRYAYARNKLIFAAGGTSTSFTNWFGVIFPATMSETVAVTGVEEQSSYEECDVCHKGSKIDFTIIMERGNNNHQPVLGFYTGDSSYFGGSSVATATTAGIAALVWARYPSWSRSQVIQRLKESGDFYPNKNSNFGYGNIDALHAVRGY